MSYLAPREKKSYLHLACFFPIVHDFNVMQFFCRKSQENIRKYRHDV
jgi:hypothetical protein